MKLDPKQACAEWEEAFGSPLTVKQAWILVKIIKHCRLRCRNNTALNNFLNGFARHLNFQQIEKIDPKTNEKYLGLNIQEKEADAPS